MEIEVLTEHKMRKCQDHASRKMEAVRACFRKSATKLSKGLAGESTPCVCMPCCVVVCGQEEAKGPKGHEPNKESKRSVKLVRVLWRRYIGQQEKGELYCRISNKHGDHAEMKEFLQGIRERLNSSRESVDLRAIRALIGCLLFLLKMEPRRFEQ